MHVPLPHSLRDFRFARRHHGARYYLTFLSLFLRPHPIPPPAEMTENKDYGIIMRLGSVRVS